MSDFLGLAGDTWQAIGTIVSSGGVAVAGGAAWVAARQYKHSKQAALDASRPYVVVTFEPSINWGSFDIVVRNVGAGPARDVSITASPKLERATPNRHSTALHESRFLHEKTPLMPPGYRLATFLDRISHRQKSDLPSRYTFTVTYNDGHGNEWTDVSVCDLALIDDLLFTEELRVHHVASALREVRDLLKKSPLIHSGEVDALVETRGERAAREEQEEAEHREFQRELEQQRREAETAEELRGDLEG